MSGPGAIGPTEPKSRLRAVDAVRGFALFGVLLVNMYNFGAYSAEWTSLVDRISFTAMHSVFETKSWRLFSLLFGFGFALQMLKMEAQAGGMWFYIRRVAILFVIGMAHVLIYDGDILIRYAVLGIILVAFRKMPTRGLLVLAFVLLAAFPIGNGIVSLSDEDQFAQDEQAQTLAERRQDHPYLGSVTDVIEANAPTIPYKIWKNNPLGPESSLAVFAMFLLGLYVGRNRIVHDVPQHLPFIRKVFRWGIGVGVTAAIGEWALTQYFGYAVFRENTASISVQFLGDVLFAYGSTALALGYAAGIVLLAQAGNLELIRRLLENLGRMALTVYLSGTLMFTLLFYGYGFGQIFLIGPAGTTAYAILFFIIQIAFCAVWLRHFRFGPMEWIWRSITYKTIQPLRLSS